MSTNKSRKPPAVTTILNSAPAVDDQPLTKLIATADRITAVASKRELDLLTEVSLAGRTNGGKSTLFSALAGPGAPCTSTSSSTTNCVITFLGDENAEGYIAHVTVQSAEDLLADVLAAVKEYHLEASKGGGNCARRENPCYFQGPCTHRFFTGLARWFVLDPCPCMPLHHISQQAYRHMSIRIRMKDPSKDRTVTVVYTC